MFVSSGDTTPVEVGSFFSKPFILWLAARKKSVADCFGGSLGRPFVGSCLASAGDGTSLGVAKLAGVVFPELLGGGIVARSGGRFLSGSWSCCGGDEGGVAILLELEGRLSGDLGPGGGGTGGVCTGGVSTRESGEYDPLDLNLSKLARELGGVCVSWRFLSDSTLDSAAKERLELSSLGVIGRRVSGRL